MFFFRFHRILFSQFYGLLTVYNIYDGLAPLLCTGISQTVSKLYIRYFSTIIQVRNWFEGDPFDRDSKSYRSLKVVRGYHRQVAAKLNEGTNRKETVDDLWMSQWSMSGAQFTFMGYMAVFPKELGFHCFTKEDFSAIFHFWRVIGYCLGIEDRFNMCGSESDEVIIEICRIMYFREYRPKIIAAPEPSGVQMTKGITYAMRQMNFMLNYNSIFAYASPFLGLDPKRYPLDTFSAKFVYGALWIYFNVLTRSTIINWLLSKFHKFKCWLAFKRIASHMETLEKRYPSTEYNYQNDERCPVKVKLNFQDAFTLNLY